MSPVRSVLLLTGYELRQRVLSRRGLIFLVPFGLFWYWALGLLADGGAQWLARPEAGLFASWLLNPEMAAGLLRDQPPSLSAFYYLCLATMPFFMILAAANQTSSDRASRYFRLLLPRALRGEIYLSRLIAVGLLAGAAIAIAWAFSVGIALSRDGRATTEVLDSALRLLPVLLLYGSSFIALMAVVSALVDSAAISALLGLTGYLLLSYLFGRLAAQWPTTGFLGFLLPGSLRMMLLNVQDPHWWSVVLVLPLYTGAYSLVGWWLFRSRDL